MNRGEVEELNEGETYDPEEQQEWKLVSGDAQAERARESQRDDEDERGAR